MNQKRVKYSIGIISLLLHLLVLIILLILYHTPSPDFSYLQSIVPSEHIPETVFYEPPIETEHDDSQWAQLNPRASMLGPSMDLSEDTPVFDNQVSTQAQEALESFDNSFNENEFTENNVDTISESSNPSESGDSSGQKKSDAQKKRVQAQQALAGMMSGYLEQLKNEGENLIKTIGGDPNKKPTAEQLKYERYLAKIQWCLQNAHTINQDKCLNHEPIQATLKLYFSLDRAGKMSNLRIIQSSGNNFADNYILSLFKSASSSFPPLPSYIKEDPYSLIYTVLVNWGVKESSYMGFARN